MEFSQIAILLVVAALAGMVARSLKQPLLIGYMFAGVFLGVFGFIADAHAFESMGQIGVALLLFLVGLEMNIRELPSIGKTAFFTGGGQIIFTSGLGYLLALALGFPVLSAIYIAIALTFSSTIIIVKLLSEKNELGTLHGKIAMGFLLVQDFVAILLLIILASIGRGEVGPFLFVEVVGKTVLLLGVLYVLSVKVLPRVFTHIIDSSGELVLIASMAWALGLAAFVGGPMGLSLEIGGFLAGLTLANLPEHLQVASKTRPLRDFFLTIFFLSLGTKLIVGNLAILLTPAAIFSLFVLIGNPLIFLIIMGLLGYRKRTSLSSSLMTAQISEFSLIIMTMGLALGHIGESEVAIVVLVGIITMTLSTYLILGTDKIYHWFEKPLNFFERKNVRHDIEHPDKPLNGHIVVVGADRTGQTVLGQLRRRKESFIVIDFNPNIVAKLTKKHYPVIFGDVNDSDVFAAANVSGAALVISTTSALHDSLLLLQNLKSATKKPLTVMKAATIKDAKLLYDRGASYVMQPDVVAGEHIRHLIKVYGTSQRIKKLGKSHRKRLKKYF